MKKKSGKLSYGCLSFISFCVIIVAWCVATYGGFVNEIFMPSPTDVWNSLVEMAKDGSLLEHCYISTKRVMVGWVWSAVAALPIGMLMARSKKFSAIVQPVIEFVRYLPVVALVPLTLLYLGIEENQKYVIIFLGTFFQLVLMVCDTVSSIDKNMINAARTLGAGKLQVYTQVIFPADHRLGMDLPCGGGNGGCFLRTRLHHSEVPAFSGYGCYFCRSDHDRCHRSCHRFPAPASDKDHCALA